MSITRLLLVVLGAICLIAGVFKLVQGPYDFLTVGIALVLLLVGYVLISGRGVTL